MNASVEEIGNNPSESINQTSESANLDQATPDENALEESESGAVSEEEEVHDENAGKKSSWDKVQSRIDELTKDKHDYRRRAERLEQELERIIATQRKPEPVAPSIQPPDPNDYAGGQYDPRYLQAQLEYTRVSAIEEAKRAVAAEYEQRAQAEKQAAAASRLETAEAATRAKFSDYDAVIEGITSDSRLAQNPTIRAALLGTDNGPEIAYILGKNLDVAYEISQMSPIQAGMRLAELMNRAPRTVKNAPAPVKPINTTGTVTGKKTYADMSTAEYIAARNAEEKAAKMARYKR
jgi:hypothetical protein